MVWQPLETTQCASFKYFKIRPEIIGLAAMLYIWFPLSLRNVENLLHECGLCQNNLASGE
ncbi:hypothetical protein SAMN05444003_3087 [Cognatiyoonia sediminum]|uniref:Transposase n=1 Tax=Cognatiyoonia sediminum TaxID=1508389 RepID=A0A1M5SSX6_9RHOB|nr:hypothetical protein SAMN05444003_3087 [Cognatiyoonia sediminum]